MRSCYSARPTRILAWAEIDLFGHGDGGLQIYRGLKISLAQVTTGMPHSQQSSGISSYRYPVHHPFIHGTRNADAVVSPLVHGLGAPEDENAPLVLKHPRHGVPTLNFCSQWGRGTRHVCG
jgi:hypothetical protein